MIQRIAIGALLTTFLAATSAWAMSPSEFYELKRKCRSMGDGWDVGMREDGSLGCGHPPVAGSAGQVVPVPGARVLRHSPPPRRPDIPLPGNATY